MLSRLSSTGPKNKEEVKDKTEYKAVEVQVDTTDQFNRGIELTKCEEDETIPWDAPSLQPPICSWSSFPLEPSAQLKDLVDFFSHVEEK